MLYIVQKDGVEYHWHTGQAVAHFQGWEFLETVAEVQADGHELEHVNEVAPGAERLGVGRHSIVWTGTLAAYIVSRL